MPNHFHLLATPADETGLARMMQWVGRYYVPYFNRKYQREGTLWQGRFKTTVIDPEKYFLTLSRFIESNPVRVELAADPAHYPWSSYAHHAGTRSDPLITDHAKYWALGNTPFDREAAYKELLNQEPSREEVEAIMAAAQTGWVLGSEQFKASIAKQASRRVTPAKRGRPRKSTEIKPV
jgi:putative transposase